MVFFTSSFYHHESPRSLLDFFFPHTSLHVFRTPSLKVFHKPGASALTSSFTLFQILLLFAFHSTSKPFFLWSRCFLTILFKTFLSSSTTISLLHQSTAASTWWCCPRPRLGWVEMAVGLPEGPSYSGHSPFIFSLCCPLNDRRRAAHSFFKIGRLFSLFSCLSLARCRLLILLLLLMSNNVHPNPGPIFPRSVCAGNVTWWGKSVQCCTCSKWVYLRCSQLSLFKFRTIGSSHL